MNTTYTLTEGNDALNRVLLMMQYDLSKTLSENIVREQKKPTDKDLKKFKDNERYNNTQKFVDNTAVSFRGPDGKRISTGTSPKTLNGIQRFDFDRLLPSKTMTFDEFMEGYRDTLTHPVMIGLEAFFLSTGVGAVGVAASYSALLVYDIYKGVTTGNWKWLDIIVEVIGVISAGVLTKPLIPIIKAAKTLKLNTLDKVLLYLSKTKIWSSIKPLLINSMQIIKNLSKNVGKFFQWMSKKTGFKFIANIPSKVQQALNWLINKISNILKVILSPTTKKSIPKAIISGVKVGGAFYLFQTKVLPFIKKLSDEKDIVKRGESSGVDEMMDNLQKNNKNYFPKKIDNIVFITNPDDTLNRMTINNEDYIITSEINYKVKKI
jgi:hypothetical protein